MKSTLRGKKKSAKSIKEIKNETLSPQLSVSKEGSARLHLRWQSPCKLGTIRLPTKQFCIHCKHLTSMLCSESLLFNFSTHEWNPDSQKLRKHYFLVLPRLVFLVKLGQPIFLMENLSSATKLCFQPNVISPICHWILQSLELIYFVVSVTPTQNTSYQTTRPVQYTLIWIPTMLYVLPIPWLYCHSAHAPISHKIQSTIEICM